MTLAVPTDKELVDYAAATYLPDAKPFISDLDSAIQVFVTARSDGLNIIAIEGTHNALGWALDFFALTMEDQEGVNHPTLGFLHAGFYAAALAVLSRLTPIAARPYAICGHSLGAALALMLGALLIDDGTAPVKIGAFAPPKCGGDQFVKVAASVPLCAYRFGLDPVPLVPLALPTFPYRQVQLVELAAPTREPDIFAYHSISNYVSGVTALNKTPSQAT